ncbi:MAG: aldo/keto reductase [Anaerolineae bacterium]|nr:aldo/keto reductase [Anaerolineae bacterium]
MQYGTVAGVDKQVSRLVLGTMIVSAQERERGDALLDAAFKQGCNTLDTAHVYGGGESERGIGLWMQARGNREEMAILTKGCHHNWDRRRVTPFDLTSDLHDSLARLQTDYVDIYLLHRDDPSVPVGPIVETLDEHRRAGRIRAYGGSNWTHERIAEANTYALAHGCAPFAASSPNYGLAEQVLDPWGPGCVSISGPANRQARAWYQAQQLPVFAYSSLARGLFSGRITRANYASMQASLDRACRTAYCHEVNFRRLDRAWELAEERGLSVPQVVLAYLFSSPLQVYPIVGAANADEFAANVAALEVHLTPEERAWLDLERDTR